jgi:type II secretory pathway pseudopilin PulG
VTISKAHGFALIDLIFVCGIIGILCSVALPRLMQARQAATASSAIASMRAINSSELTFALTCGSGFYAPNLTTLGRAPAGSTESFISPGLGGADVVMKSSYRIQLTAAAFAGAPGSCNALPAGEAGSGFRAGADPVEVGNIRFFGTNALNAIFEDTTTLFTTMPEAAIPPSGHPLR